MNVNVSVSTKKAILQYQFSRPLKCPKALQMMLKEEIKLIHHSIYSGTRNDVDTTAVFTAVLGDVLTLDKNNS